VEIEPNPEGGVAFAEKVVGGVVPKNFFPAWRRASAPRRPTGSWPAIAGRLQGDAVRRLLHTVDSNDLSSSWRRRWPQEGRHGLPPVLQEPIMNVEIRVPERFMGDVNRDLNGRRGRVMGMDVTGDGMQVIIAQVPQASSSATPPSSAP